MKMMKDENGKVVMYNVRNEELNRNLRKLGHKVVPNKKKQAQKNACRKGWQKWRNTKSLLNEYASIIMKPINLDCQSIQPLLDFATGC